MASLLSLGAVTVADYQVTTGDSTTASSAVSAALLEAEALLEEELRRQLASEERTKAFKIWPDGALYPDAWPITDAGDLRIIGTRTLLGAEPDDSPFLGVWPTVAAPPMATVTWTGGFTASTLPATLERALYDLAKAILSDSPVPVGATSMSVGDVSVSFGAPTSGGLDSLLPGLATRVARYRNRFVG